MRVAVLGASGFTGRLVAATLDGRGVRFTPAGRDRARLDDAAAGLAHADPVQIADVGDADAVAALATGHDVLISTVGPFDVLGRDVLAACAAHGCHYVDVSGEQSFVRWAHERVGPAAQDAGVAAVPSSSFDYGIGDLLAAVAAGAVEQPQEAHIAYVVPGALRPRRASRGTRATLATMLGEPFVALRDGTLREERLAESRRLAWFPRPVGPRHAAGIPGGEALSVPRHVPGIATVATYWAVPGWLAELAQALGAAARSERVADLARAALVRSPDPRPDDLAATRWGCVAEVLDASGAVARAWANGHDVYGLTAEIATTIALRLPTAGVAGVVAPAEVAPAGALLDELAARTDLRWSLSRPTPPAPR